MKFPDEFLPLLYRFRKLAVGERSTFLVRFQTIDYLHLALDRDLTSGDEIELLIAGESPDGAVSHLANNRLFIDCRVARPAQLHALRPGAVHTDLYARLAQTALKPRSRFEHLKDDPCQRLIIPGLAGRQFGMVVEKISGEFFLQLLQCRKHFSEALGEAGHGCDYTKPAARHARREADYPSPWRSRRFNGLKRNLRWRPTIDPPSPLDPRSNYSFNFGVWLWLLAVIVACEFDRERHSGRRRVFGVVLAWMEEKDVARRKIFATLEVLHIRQLHVG